MSFDAFASVPSAAPAPATSAPPVAEHVSSESSGKSAENTATSSASAADATVTEKIQSLVKPPVDETKTPETPPWEPNFKFKVMDQDHEMDEYFKQFVKTPEDEKKFREVYEKAYGLDVVKPKYQALREKYTQAETQVNQYNDQVQELASVYKRGDFEGFFQKLGIPEEKVLQWVIDKAQYKQLPPEQRKVLDDKRFADDRVFQLERQMQTIQQTYEAQVTQAKVQGLQIALEKPDVKHVASMFDSKKGAGAFFQEVANYGQAVWYQTQGKIDLSPEQAVQAVMERLTVFGGPQATSQQPPVVAASAAPGTKPPVKSIPNLSGRNSSAVGQPKIRSLADLKKLANQTQ